MPVVPLSKIVHHKGEEHRNGEQNGDKLAEGDGISEIHVAARSATSQTTARLEETAERTLSRGDVRSSKGTTTMIRQSWDGYNGPYRNCTRNQHPP